MSAESPKYWQPLLSLAAKMVRTGYSYLPITGITRPVFVLGCGRSGTSVFGNALGLHSKVCYLHEPRMVWAIPFPQTNIWTNTADGNRGRLVMTEADSDPYQARRLRRLFRLQRMIVGGDQVVEKFPIHSFRLEFLRTIFPDARYIFIHRNGLEVARSIERQVERGRWFRSSKWEALVEYAAEQYGPDNQVELCDSYRDKGLLEWRLSNEAIIRFLRTLPDDRFTELSYEQLIERPVETLERVFTFMEMVIEPHIITDVERSIQRRTSSLSDIQPTQREWDIGGRLLAISMEGTSDWTDVAVDDPTEDAVSAGSSPRT